MRDEKANARAHTIADPPAGVLDALRPDPLRRWLHERYMPARKVCSLEPMWRPDFSFYFLPLFKRLLPDLLMMGRRGAGLSGTTAATPACLVAPLLPT
ncbi:MAG: hypothetical protein ACLFVO_02075 [Chloroflexaceae bacterium]